MGANQAGCFLGGSAYHKNAQEKFWSLVKEELLVSEGCLSFLTPEMFDFLRKESPEG